MYFSVKKIANKEYYYASDNLYIAKGKSKLKNKSLGRVDGALHDRWDAIKIFEAHVIEEETKKRLEYWKPKIDHTKGFTYSLEKLEKLRSTIYRSKSRLGPFGEHFMEAAFKVDFIYNSNKLEGSRVPRKTIENIVRKGGHANAEVANSLAALSFIRNLKKLRSEEDVVKLHKVLLEHEKDLHGIRQEAVVVGNSDTLDFKKIKPALKNLFKWYREQNHKLYPPELAFLFYYKFERIHPFIDGNGRIGRLLMNFILKEHRYHPIIIWNQNRQAHMSAFQEAIKGQVHKYLKFMNKQMIQTYEIYTEKIAKAQSIEQSIDQTFFRPSR